MNIEKKVIQNIYSEDGAVVEPGTLCEFTVGAKSLCGIYQGITPKGALRFQNTVMNDVFYNVMPASIGTMRIAGVKA